MTDCSQSLTILPLGRIDSKSTRPMLAGGDYEQLFGIAAGHDVVVIVCICVFLFVCMCGVL